ncbi:hypothetical protein P7K49_005554 [Saguinus oedipus]|uniref:Uncharacterized protein n=1 Tax=Saguinus oedipus TaxID=9490 RepID=A0ABQ9VZW3_SAGOE|nr:hypothetical protein P7K49_005554 [Saguinus oedipus]
MPGNGSALPNASRPVPGGDAARPVPSWPASTLACVLIFTIVVDVLGNLLVILSVYRNKKLRNAEAGTTTEQPLRFCRWQWSAATSLRWKEALSRPGTRGTLWTQKLHCLLFCVTGAALSGMCKYR